MALLTAYALNSLSNKLNERVVDDLHAGSALIAFDIMQSRYRKKIVSFCLLLKQFLVLSTTLPGTCRCYKNTYDDKQPNVALHFLLSFECDSLGSIEQSWLIIIAFHKSCAKKTFCLKKRVLRCFSFHV